MNEKEIISIIKLPDQPCPQPKTTIRSDFLPYFKNPSFALNSNLEGKCAILIYNLIEF